MAEEKKDPWLNYLAVTTVVLAVSATLSTFYGQRYSTRTVISEIKASNQWNWFQAKRIRAYLVEAQKDNIQNSLSTIDRATQAPLAENLEKRMAGYSAKLKEWDQEQKEISENAKKLEQTRDQAMKHGSAFGYAVIFLQLAILLSSIAALMKKKGVWIIGLIVGAFGLLLFADGFWLFLEPMVARIGG
ncbi:MAG: DUF4337 domain-containing protein [Thermodesulfobacteriota bacterium]